MSLQDKLPLKQKRDEPKTAILSNGSLLFFAPSEEWAALIVESVNAHASLTEENRKLRQVLRNLVFQVDHIESKTVSEARVAIMPPAKPSAT